MCIYNNTNKIITIINNKMLKLTEETFITQEVAILLRSLPL